MDREALTFDVFVDHEIFSPGTRFRLTGRAVVGLVPSLFQLMAWDLPESEVYRLMNAKEIAVKRNQSCLASGVISDVFQRTVPEGTVTYVAFSLGLDLWESFVSLFVDAGKTVSETVKEILNVSGTGYQLLTFPGCDPVFSRGQAYLGRAAECVEEALAVASARGYLIPSAVGVIPADPPPAVLHLKESDLLDKPSYVDDRRKVILSTDVIGYQPGDEMDLEYKGRQIKGVILERMIQADTKSGPWNTQLLVELDEARWRSTR